MRRFKVIVITRAIQVSWHRRNKSPQLVAGLQKPQRPRGGGAQNAEKDFGERHTIGERNPAYTIRCRAYAMKKHHRGTEPAEVLFPMNMPIVEH